MTIRPETSARQCDPGIPSFQTEPRAQMSTLPRLRPKTFNDLAVAVSLIQPDPSRGGSIHPYPHRRAAPAGAEERAPDGGGGHPTGHGVPRPADP
ncbi:hypothetical protein [Streptomyces eurocidicus]|uniref:hypothetical protein n=1 Tax=Streptomyces eurocidicus TaxID=66423 RepID=UPI003CC82ECC